MSFVCRLHIAIVNLDTRLNSGIHIGQLSFTAAGVLLSFLLCKVLFTTNDCDRIREMSLILEKSLSNI